MFEIFCVMKDIILHNKQMDQLCNQKALKTALFQGFMAFLLDKRNQNNYIYH